METKALEIVSTDWRPVKNLRVREFRREPGFGGYAVSEEEILQLWAEHRMYPLTAVPPIEEDAVAMYAHWLCAGGIGFDVNRAPWIPLGVLGPLLIMGHFDPAVSEPPLPWGTFQAVLLKTEEYDERCANVSRLLDASLEGRKFDASLVVEGVGRFPNPLVLPTNRENALRFLAEYYLHQPELLQLLNRASEGLAINDSSIPASYVTALWFVMGEGAVAPACCWNALSNAPRLIPEPLRKKISPVCEVGRSLWCMASSLPQAEAEDRLYAELGEGWSIHWILRAPEENPHRGADFTQATSSSTATPFKIVLGAGVQSRGDKSDLIEAEERLIVLEEKEWGRFDPRHRDSAEPESLWKWSVYKSLLDGATDLHIEPGPTATRVRQRVDGLLEEILEVPAAVGEAMVYSLMTQVGLGSDKYRPADGSFQVELVARVSSRNQTVRVRASAYPVRGVTLKVALRFLPRQGSVPKLESILPARPARYVERAISRPEGLILVCGPTGSGKTTTIFSALSGLNRPDLNVTTLENPVEILLEGTNQAEVNTRRDVTWSSLNRAFLRQDPDVGLIGEIRDEDTAQTILRAALTGHLVFGSLHTKSCPTSVIRMTDLGAEPNILAESLILVECQRLVRRLCPHCRQDHRLTPAESRIFEKHRLAPPPMVARPGSRTGTCEYCRGRGYRGRAAAVEILPNVPAVRRMIEDRAVSQIYAEWMKEHGLYTVFENALELASDGITSLEEALTLQDAWDGEEWNHLN